MITRPIAVLLVLTALNLVNYLDRYLVVGVGTALQNDLHIDDAQFGSVTSAFMWGYFITSPIFGWLGDRYPRKWLIASGVAIWSVATAVSGLAATYHWMLLARVVVGVGEASYATLSPTIVDDLFSSSTKNRALAVFYVAIPVGSALGFLLGGQLQAHLGWRSAFFIAGGPGILLSILVLFLREPDRQTSDKASHDRSVYLQLLRRPRYVYTVLGYVAQTFALGGFASFAVLYLHRKYALDPKDAATAFGAITVVAGLGATAFGGVLADRLPGKDRLHVNLLICAWSSLLAAPLAGLSLVAPTAVTFMAALGACQVAIFASTSPTNAAVLGSVPETLRANGMALSIFGIHLFGDMVSPPLIGRISDANGGGAKGLEVGMYMLPVALALSALAWFKGVSARDEGGAPPKSAST